MLKAGKSVVDLTCETIGTAMFSDGKALDYLPMDGRKSLWFSGKLDSKFLIVEKDKKIYTNEKRVSNDFFKLGSANRILTLKQGNNNIDVAFLGGTLSFTADEKPVVSMSQGILAIKPVVAAMGGAFKYDASKQKATIIYKSKMVEVSITGNEFVAHKEVFEGLGCSIKIEK